MQQVRSVKMYTRDDCAPCLQWKRDVAPYFLRAGFTIEYVYSDGPVPRYQIISDGQVFSWDSSRLGYLSLDRARALLRSKR